MKRMNYLAIAMLGMMSGSVLAATGNSLTVLTDSELSAETGQALFNMSYIGPGGSNPNVDTGFYKLGMEAQLDLNANIKKLQLGCGGVKGAGCDIDLDNVSFTGIVPTGNMKGGADAGPTSDFTLINPFYEIAIKNPTSAATRELVGFKIGADSIWGMLSIGSPPTDGRDANVAANHTGINSISGHMPTIINNGIVPTTICSYAPTTQNDCTGFLNFAVTSTNSTIDYDPAKPNENRFDLILQRASQVDLNGIKVKSLLGLTINANLDQDLRFIHNITAGSDPNGNKKYDPGESVNNFGISVQGQDVMWNTNGKWLNAQKGWWMELPESKIENFTTRRVYTTLGAIFGLDLKDLNQNQFPVDNCYGGLTFC
ncbi:hypothetical protein ACKVE0_02710 [Acinetobacter albensis]|uniref:Uncharacterized protein n=1 Tax=Acinetobacter albensis TaxID=1673609 RepID=A0ABW9JQ01_9GAMM